MAQKADAHDKDVVLLRRVLIGVLAVALLGAVVFGVRALASFVYWHDEAHQSQPIAGWMTPRYVGKSWQVPPEVIADALALRLEAGTGRTPLTEIAKARNQDLSVIIDTLQAAIDAHLATRP
ncbi:hypothetical protein [Litoreibacter albidus]|uniref:Uncharacterized protein n=1 Tax=Litoreibacter albidus TaxID=670155 RepID=A0A1H2YAS3_9RHOB|nr:hypothetical protein [Litoreibacter albidus]SDX02217.1 hypothetical protein SAMN04488001_2273 [Litoreibacter albidus]